MIEQQPATKINLEFIAGKGILNHYINYIHLVGGLSSVDRANAPWDKMPPTKASEICSCTMGE